MRDKKEKILQSMDLLDEKYIAEAAPEKRRIPAGWRRYGKLVACFCLALTLGLYLFLPPDTTPADVSKYSGSAYYSIIQKLHEATYEKPLYKNNFEKIVVKISNLFSLLTKGGAESANPGRIDGTYKETTDNQVAGVIEADLIKRSDKYIYYLNGNMLMVYLINGEQTKIVGTYFLSNKNYQILDNSEFFLSEDCETITIVAKCRSKEGTDCVGVISLDVSDPDHIVEKKSFFMSGFYITSRMSDGKLLLFSKFLVHKNTNFSNEKTFLPQIDDGSGMKSIPANDIISPETLSLTQYTVVYMFDEATLEKMSCKALLSYSDTFYVSTDSIYATRRYNELKDNKTSVAMTEVLRLMYTGETLDYKGTVSMNGYINNQYSLDAYENILRVVTTTDTNGATSASLYCIDIDTLKIAAAVTDFAPKGEMVRSVRFDKKTAYVCTAVQFTDPVFFFDLSDLNNISYKDTGTIEGFSTSLVNFGDGYLLGIGTGNMGNELKIEIYKESENHVVSVCKYEIEYVKYSTAYKSYFIDRENMLVGLGYKDFNNNNEPERYLLLKFENDRLEELVNLPLAGEVSMKRAVLVDGYFYMFGPGDFKIKKLELQTEK